MASWVFTDSTWLFPILVLCISYTHNLGAGQSNHTILLLATVQLHYNSQGTLQPCLLHFIDPDFKQLVWGIDLAKPQVFFSNHYATMLRNQKLRQKWRETEQPWEIERVRSAWQPRFVLSNTSLLTALFRNIFLWEVQICQSKHCDTWSTPHSRLSRSMLCDAEGRNKWEIS